MDIFLLDCLFYYVQTNGMHPFGRVSFERQLNILAGTPTLDEIKITQKNLC